MSFEFASIPEKHKPSVGTAEAGAASEIKVSPVKSVRTRAGLVVGALCGLVALVIVFISSAAASTYLRDQVGRTFEVEANQIVKRLDTELHERLREVVMVAESWPLYGTDPDALKETQRALLNKLQSSYEAYAWAGFVSADGDIVVGANGLLEGTNVADHEWFTKGMTDTFFGNLHDTVLLAPLLPNPNSTAIRLIDIITPVRDQDGNAVGVLIADLNWDWMETFVARVGANLDSVRDTPQTTEVMIVDANNISITTLSDVSLSGQTVDVVAKLLTTFPPEQHYGVIEWQDGQRYLTGFARSDDNADGVGLGWGVIVRQPEQDALIPVSQLQVVLVTSGVIITLITLLCGYYIAGFLTRPLLRLTQSAEKMIAGDPGVDFPALNTSDEFAVLTVALNQLLTTQNQQNQTLAQSNISLEQRIIERTATLERRARELADEVSTRKQLESALTESRESFRRLAETQLDGLMVIVEGVIIYSNRALSEIFGYAQWELVRMSETDFITDEDHAVLDLMYEQTDQQLYEVTGLRKDGDLFPLEISGRMVSYSGSLSKVLTLRDISERKYAEIEIQKLLELAQTRLDEVQLLNNALEYRSTHDHLTGLANRQFFEARLDDAIEHAPETGLGAAILYLDLDRFKEINDLLGHNAGDQLLKLVTARMQTIITTDKMLARMGGDEFAVMIDGLSRRAEAATFARQLLALFAEPFTIQKRQVHISASIGISFFPEHGHTVEVLMRKADLALYLAKMEGRSTFRMVDESAEIDLLAQMQLEVDLRQALERGELSLNFQPIASADGLNIYAVEALLRWTHPTLGLIAPSRFIPLAEISDTILPIGRWVALEACKQAQQWRQAGIEVRVAINVSPRQFEDDHFLAGIDHALAESGLPASALEIEVTESLLIRDIEQKASILNHLNARGVKLAIDDFGTGFSSLHHLQKLPIDTLKIDQSFIADLDEDKPNQSARASAIIRAISQMAHSLDIDVVAEGIETRYQMERAQALECDALQGYLIGRPMIRQDIETLLTQQH